MAETGMDSTKNWVAARYDPRRSRSFAIDAVIWLVPAAIIVVLACMEWRSTHGLDPYRPDTAIEPPHVDVVAQEWQWRSTDPEDNIAVADALLFPSERLLSMTLTPYGEGRSADQYFETTATAEDDFDAWTAKVRQSPNALDSVAYRVLVARGIARAATHRSAAEPPAASRGVADEEARWTPSTDAKVRFALPLVIDP
jgi:cytochrome o ubiquinol oxidase subunit 2